MATPGAAPTPEQQQEMAITMATAEMEFRVDMCYRMAQQCFDKCLDKRYGLPRCLPLARVTTMG